MGFNSGFKGLITQIAKKFTTLYGTRIFKNCFNKSFLSFLSQATWNHRTFISLFKVCCNSVFPSSLRSPKWIFPSCTSSKFSVYLLCTTHACYVTSITPSLFLWMRDLSLSCRNVTWNTAPIHTKKDWQYFRKVLICLDTVILIVFSCHTKALAQKEEWKIYRLWQYQVTKIFSFLLSLFRYVIV